MIVKSIKINHENEDMLASSLSTFDGNCTSLTSNLKKYIR